MNLRIDYKYTNLKNVKFKYQNAINQFSIINYQFSIINYFFLVN